MTTFLLWTHGDALRQDKTPDQVASRLKDTFAPLFKDPLEVHLRSGESAYLAYSEEPLRGWKPASFQEDEELWALALDYPLNPRKVLGSRGISFTEDNLLLSLCRQLEQDPTPLLRDLAPPFALIWGRKEGGSVFFQNDGLGQAQVFEYRCAHRWVLTNRILALQALGIELEPEPIEWATRFTIGWFPLAMTGYKNCRFLEPATQVQIDRNGTHQSSHDVLSSWVCPEPRSKEECLELARSSFLELIRENAPLWENPGVGLSGGWDSRAVVAALRAEGAQFSARVRGNPKRYDVMIASKLAEIAGFKIRIKTSSGLPPQDAKRCRRSIARALLWQAGSMPTLKHKTFLAKKEHLEFGGINIMGQHGGLGKADYVVKINAHDLDPKDYEDRLLAKLCEDMPAFLRADLRESVSEVIRDAYRQADRYQLSGLARLHFFFLYEYTRRWSSASLKAQTGLILAPYLNPDFIRACYAYPAAELTDRPFHRYITGTLAPEWADYPYDGQVTKEQLRDGTIPRANVRKRKRQEYRDSARWKHSKGHKKYNYRIYWQEIGSPIIAEALAEGGFWTSIFDADLARTHWESSPDPLAIAHILPEVLQQVPQVTATDLVAKVPEHTASDLSREME